MGSRRSNPSVKPGQKNPIDSNTIRSSSLRDCTPRLLQRSTPRGEKSMRRRDFLTGLAVMGGDTTLARLSSAQAPRKMTRVGIATIQPPTGPLWTAFEQRLKELGYAEGENLAVEFIDLNGTVEKELR